MAFRDPSNPQDPDYTPIDPSPVTGPDQTPIVPTPDNTGATTTTPAPGSNGTPGHTTLTPQQYVTAWRQQHPNIQLKQSSPAGWDQLAKDMQAVGFNVSVAPPSSGGYIKGILLDGQFVKLADGNDNPTWEMGGGSGSSEGGGIDPQYLQPFTTSFSDFAPTAFGTGGSDFSQIPQFHAPGAFQPPTAESLLSDPGYQFRKGEAQNALQNSAAAKGLINSGGTIYDQMKLGDAMAGQEYNNAWSRNMNLWDSDWAHAVTDYGLQRGANDTAYGRAMDQWKNLKDTFYSNESNPFDKLYKMGSLGANAAAG